MRGVPLGQHLRSEQADLTASARQALLTATFLAHQSWVMARRHRPHAVADAGEPEHLLEWESASDAARRLSSDAASVWRQLWISPALAVVARVCWW